MQANHLDVLTPTTTTHGTQTNYNKWVNDFQHGCQLDTCLDFLVTIYYV